MNEDWPVAATHPLAVLSFSLLSPLAHVQEFLSRSFNTGISGALSFPGLVDEGCTSDGAACEARGLTGFATGFLCDPGKPCPFPGPKFLHL